MGNYTVVPAFQTDAPDAVSQNFTYTGPTIPAGHTAIFCNASTVDDGAAGPGWGGWGGVDQVSDSKGNIWRRDSPSGSIDGTNLFSTAEIWSAWVVTPITNGTIVTIRGDTRGLSPTFAILDIDNIAPGTHKLDKYLNGYGQAFTDTHLDAIAGVGMNFTTAWQTSSAANAPRTRYANSIAIACFAVGSGTAAGNAFAPPADWTELYDVYAAGNSRGLVVCYKELPRKGDIARCAGTLNTSGSGNGCIAVYRMVEGPQRIFQVGGFQVDPDDGVAGADAFQLPWTNAFETALSGFQDGGFYQPAFEEFDADQGDAFQLGSRPADPTPPPSGVSGAGTIPTAEAFGTTQIQRQVREDGTGIVTGEVFGTAALQRLIGVTGISTGVAFGTTQILRLVGPTGIASSAAVGQPTLNRVFAQGISTGAAVGQPAVQRRVGPTGISTGEAFGTVKFTRLLGPTGLVTGVGFGTTAVQRQVREDGTGIASGAAVGQPTIAIVPPGLSGVGGIASGQAFGTTQVQRRVGTLGIASGAAVGTPERVGQATGITSAGGIASGEGFGTTTVKRQVREDGTGITSGAALGQPQIGRQLGTVGIASSVAFGTAKLQRQLGTLGIATGEAVGTPRIIRVTTQGIASQAAVGVPKVGVDLLSIVGSATISDRGRYDVAVGNRVSADVRVSDRTAVDIRVADRSGG